MMTRIMRLSFIIHLRQYTTVRRRTTDHLLIMMEVIMEDHHRTTEVRRIGSITLEDESPT